MLARYTGLVVATRTVFKLSISADGEDVRTSMKSRLRRIAVHIIILVALLVIMSAVAILLDLGPVAHSALLSN